MAEERDVPDLGTLVNDVAAAGGRLDAAVAANKGDPVRLGEVLASFLQNDVVPLLKDVVESTLYGMQDLQDLADPITIPGGVAQDMADLLNALKAQNSGNPELVGRIDEALEHLTDDDDAEEGDEES